MRHDFEDDLMNSCLSEELPYLKCLDVSRLGDLYSKYRALPETLTGDQNALIYASLCLARYSRLRRAGALRSKNQSTQSREDLTYYRMAREALESWETASITGICESLVSGSTDARGSFLSCLVRSLQRESRGLWGYHRALGTIHQGAGTTQTRHRSNVP